MILQGGRALFFLQPRHQGRDDQGRTAVEVEPAAGTAPVFVEFVQRGITGSAWSHLVRGNLALCQGLVGCPDLRGNFGSPD